MSPALNIDEWTTVYVAYSLTAQGYGVSTVFINGIYRGFKSITTAPLASSFTNADIVKIGGGFTGQLRRMQIYSPAAFGLASGSSKQKIFWKKKIPFPDRGL